MEENILKGKWKEIKGGIKEQWGKLTDDDLITIEGQEEKLIGILQKKYGYSKEEADKQYRNFIVRYREKEHLARK